VQGQLFSPLQIEQGAAVCVIGQGIRSRFFSQIEPIGSRIKCGNQWLTVVGVLESRNVSESAASNLGIRNYDMDVYTPISTALIRYTNRNTLTKAMIQKADMDDDDDEKKEKKTVNYHQIDRIVIQIEDTDKLASTAELVARILQRRHLGVTDYEVSIPELLLKQQQRTKDIFNIVLGVIASISLVVGGIGIMNIMLASVLERIKEIGLRISLGAKKSDIVLQFMCEAMLISISGGLIGIMLGVALAIGISQLADIPTIVSGTSVALSFLVAASVGLIFGITPAKRASEQDPITCLRYE
jgi:putative ABC transport system permease protein